MAVQTPQAQLDPYTSTVPLVQIPQQDLERQAPLPANTGFMTGKAGGIATIGNDLFRGVLKGLQIKEEKKAATANATINALDKATADSFQQYQEAIAQNKAPADQAAAYQVYLKQFNDAKAAKAKFVIPEKPKKGADKTKKKDDQAPAAGGFGAGIKQFFERNPHIIPELALVAMQPKPPGPTTDTVETKNRLQEQSNTLTTQQQQIEANKQNSQITAYNFQRNQTEDQRKDSERKVMEMGGPEAIIQKAQQKDPTVTPDLLAAANVLQNTADPSVIQKRELWKKVQDFQAKQATDPKATMNPMDRIMAGEAGLMPAIQTPKVFKNGKNYQEYIDPATGKPLLDAKGKPMQVDLGTPEEMALHYQERAEKRSDLFKAIDGNPEQFGIPQGLDSEAKKARVNQIVDLMGAAQDNRLIFAAMSKGITPYEAGRENAVVSGIRADLMKETGRGKNSIDIPGIGTQTPQQVDAAARQFFVDDAEGEGLSSVRQQPIVPPGQTPEQTEAYRQWAYNHYVHQLMTQKGAKGKELSEAEAKRLADQTSLGKPVPTPPTSKASAGGFAKPTPLGVMRALDEMSGNNLGGNPVSGRPQSQQSTGQSQIFGAPGSGKKLYAVIGEDGTSYGAYLDDNQLKQAQQQGLNPEEVPQ